MQPCHQRNPQWQQDDRTNPIRSEGQDDHAKQRRPSQRHTTPRFVELTDEIVSTGWNKLTCGGSGDVFHRHTSTYGLLRRRVARSRSRMRVPRLRAAERRTIVDATLPGTDVVAAWACANPKAGHPYAHADARLAQVVAEWTGFNALPNIETHLISGRSILILRSRWRAVRRL